MFANFWLIVMVIYQLKPVSRSLFISDMGAHQLPWVWIGSAAAMGLFLPFYNRLIRRASGRQVALGSCLLICAMLVGFRWAMAGADPAVSVAFYIFVDLISVVIVEQFWSLCNAIYDTDEGMCWYGIIGTGGLMGGMTGGAGAAALIHYTSLKTLDLLLVAAGLVLLLFALTWLMSRFGIYCSVDRAYRRTPIPRAAWRVLLGNHYLMLVAGILMLSQLAAPIVEYQFLNTVARRFEGVEARTAFLSMFFGMLGLVSILINLALTPIIHRRLGVITGLFFQPLALAVCSFFFFLHPTVIMAAATKITDRGLANSINRVSRELLYVPINPVLVYPLKSLIDMFGFRLFKVFGALVILVVTRWLPVQLSLDRLSIFIMAVCVVWTLLVMDLREHYRRLIRRVKAARTTDN